MKKLYASFFLLSAFSSFAQVNNNGTLDAIEEFSTKYTVPFVMPDGIKLMTDVYVPIVRDCLMVHYDTLTFDILGQSVVYPVNQDLEVIKKGTQIIIYDSLNGDINPDPYQLPLVFTRTPYGKSGSDAAGALINLLGFSYAMQDMRGRYTSQGVYLPMLSDSWSKVPYHPDFAHTADITPLSDPKNSNKHEDGYNSIKFICNNLSVQYGNNPKITGNICNGSVGGFGASALGNTQYQYAAAHKIVPYGPGLKSLLPIVATNEHYRYTGFQNGVFRERIVTGWLKGQILDLDDDLRSIDNDVQNDIHTSKDYNLPTKFDVAFRAIDHFTLERYNGYLPGYYPNSKGRSEMDASHAKVYADGEAGDGKGTYSRYINSQVPAFHLTGWWDIFVDGQIETFENMRKHCNDSLKKLQKLVIGPWAHQTIGTQKTGDMTYPRNVIDITKFDVEDVDVNNLPINDVLNSELVQWFRYTLNYNNWKNTGDPKIIIPESQDWQDFGATMQIRIPSKDYIIKFEELFNYLNGTQGLNNFPVQVKGTISVPPFGSIPIDSNITVSIPNAGEPLLPGLNDEPVTGVNPPDFSLEWKVPPVRFYVVGPNGDGIPENDSKGNYWFGYNTFPPTKLTTPKKMYLHQNGLINFTIPSTDEGFVTYVSDPDDPIKTVGGANMIVKNPNGDGRDSQGQMNLAEPSVKNLTMDRAGVAQFVTPKITEANGFTGDSLAIIGFPRMGLYAKTNPAGTTSGVTDADFMVRVLDVYPDGREFFVVEGCVNARGREYARSIANGSENDEAPFSNINIGWVYGYGFKLMPIAYTWGKNHRMKILISSNNHPRYQANPQVPIEEGEFFRRQPLDGRSYMFQGEQIAPRKAVQRIAFAPNTPTYIELPMYQTPYVGTEEEATIPTSLDMLLYPNPSGDELNIYLSKHSDYRISIKNISGQQVFNTRISDDQLLIDVKKFPVGMYFIESEEVKTGERKVQKFSVVR